MASPGDLPNACLLPFTQSKSLISVAHTQRKHFEMKIWRGQGYLGWYLSPCQALQSIENKVNSTALVFLIVFTRSYIFDRIVSKEPHLEDNFHKCSHLCYSSVPLCHGSFLWSPQKPGENILCDVHDAQPSQRLCQKKRKATERNTGDLRHNPGCFIIGRSSGAVTWQVGFWTCKGKVWKKIVHVRSWIAANS